MKTKSDLAKFDKYLIFCNSSNPDEWVKHVEGGADKIYRIGTEYYLVEDSSCTKSYTYRTRWFQKCRIPRFTNPANSQYVPLPLSSPHVHQIVLTDRLSNFSCVNKFVAQAAGVAILDVNQLTDLFNQSISTLSTTPITITDNVYSSPNISVIYSEDVREFEEEMMVTKRRESERLRFLYSG